MGAVQSADSVIGGSSMGYQVLRVYPNSPGSRAGLKAYFDFIISIGNTRFSKESGSLREILKASVDQKLRMTVFNTRTRKVRDVEIVPSTNWGGNGLLGVSIKHTSFDRADERVWHVVDVEPNSPAQQAGFKVGEDYVIGSDSILQESDDLYNLVEAHEGKALKLFLYNVNTDNCREVICHPNSKWGGKGYLGCEFGHGLLHRIPEGSSEGKEHSLKSSVLPNQQSFATSDQSLSNSLQQQRAIPNVPIQQLIPQHQQHQLSQQQLPQQQPPQHQLPQQYHLQQQQYQLPQQHHQLPQQQPLPSQQQTGIPIVPIQQLMPQQQQLPPQQLPPQQQLLPEQSHQQLLSHQQLPQQYQLPQVQQQHQLPPQQQLQHLPQQYQQMPQLPPSPMQQQSGIPNVPTQQQHQLPHQHQQVSQQYQEVPQPQQQEQQHQQQQGPPMQQHQYVFQDLPR